MSLEDGIDDLYVILISEIIPMYLERDYKKFYNLDNDMINFECMADDVSRAWRLVVWHDKLAEVDTSLWKFLESDDPDDLELRSKESTWLLRLEERIHSELLNRKSEKKELE